MLYLVFGLMLSVSNGAMADKTCYDPDSRKMNSPMQYNVADNVHCCEMSCKGNGQGASALAYPVITDYTDYLNQRCSFKIGKKHCEKQVCTGSWWWQSCKWVNCSTKWKYDEVSKKCVSE